MRHFWDLGKEYFGIVESFMETKQEAPNDICMLNMKLVAGTAKKMMSHFRSNL